ncbi:MAG: hypothetical protein OEU54_10125 [Gemmatimonadota bacterium]|nr:hypothetical protein [Gemmatimonadota bacterium]
MKKAHVLGLTLWRGGLIAAVGYAAFEALRRVLSITDTQLELAITVVLTGVVLVFLSLVGERIADARAEGGLRE